MLGGNIALDIWRQASEYIDMSYLCLVTFDLSNASAENYQEAYKDLAQIGFSTTVTGSSDKQISLPNTTCVGEFSGSDAASIRDSLVARVQSAFKARGFSSKIFVMVGGDWAWGYKTTD